MKDSTRNSLRDDLWEYQVMQKEIKAFRESVMYPYKETDENFGGGSSGYISDPTSNIAMKLASPIELHETQKFIAIVDACLKRVDVETRAIIESKYINGYKHKKNCHVASDTHFSESTVKKRDNEFLELLRIKLGRR